MNPPIVYEVTNPSAHMIKRITKIVQSMFQLLSQKTYPVGFPIRPMCSRLSSWYLAFGFRSGVNRAAAMTHQFLSFFDDSFGNLPKFLPMLIQVIEGLTTALTERFPRSLPQAARPSAHLWPPDPAR